MAGSTRTRKYLKWSLIVLVIILIAYALGWFFIARTVKARIFELLEGQDGNDTVVSCEDIGYQGFPTSFGFFCDSLHVRDRNTDAVFDTPRLLAEAPVYSPWSVMATVTGPATLDNDAGMILRSEWEHLGGKLIYGRAAPRLISFDVEGLTARFAVPAGRQGTLTAEYAQGLVRNDDGDLDLALTVTNGVLRPQNNAEALPSVSVNLLATVDDGGELLATKQIRSNRLRGKSGILNQATLAIGERASHIAVSGRFAFDKEGYLDGRFSVELTGIDGISQVLQLAFPEVAQPVDTVTGLIKSFTGGQRTMALDVRVNQGRAMLGFIPLGRIPPV
ncbi:DUF2125 domain-containing protein [Martelella lutilitoris]|uniref:DUF2125 domain-containing protein n=1 Tax=Martelella lutilitoris TaxID=2583532 RepID=A0A5C4JPE2_9HYPH|nr:DUF2125 domain-containing protein [Martelella lutilitoris]TNB46479.1 DUF2125 domain-containing protein [Martelella lutilitoris]